MSDWGLGESVEVTDAPDKSFDSGTRASGAAQDTVPTHKNRTQVPVKNLRFKASSLLFTCCLSVITARIFSILRGNDVEQRDFIRLHGIIHLSIPQQPVAALQLHALWLWQRSQK